MLIKDVNLDTKEGMILIVAIGALKTFPVFADKTLDEILQILEKVNTLLKVDQNHYVN